jgi:hypothetical protein
MADQTNQTNRAGRGVNANLLKVKEIRFCAAHKFYKWRAGLCYEYSLAYKQLFAFQNMAPFYGVAWRCEQPLVSLGVIDASDRIALTTLIVGYVPKADFTRA